MYLSRMHNPWYSFTHEGKHNGHDVKTIKKAHPIVKN
jgi:hypothetical protein